MHKWKACVVLSEKSIQNLKNSKPLYSWNKILVLSTFCTKCGNKNDFRRRWKFKKKKRILKHLRLLIYLII